MRVKALLKFVTLLLLACGSDRVHRSDLHRWNMVELPSAGIVLAAPADASNLQMHYLSNGLADATWMISISVRRTSRTAFENPARPDRRNRASSDAQYMKWLSWLQDFHPAASRFDMPNGSEQYRRDLPLPDGDIASIHVTYQPAPFTPEERRADETAIRRILDSARPIQR
ncbi:MAG TPA: hypothetical protein VF980_15815 [Thermoanaerobaculia bacterium]